MNISILAVNDPAVQTYVNDELGILELIRKELDIDIKIDIIDFIDYYDRMMQSLINGTDDIVMIAGHLWLPSLADSYLSHFQLEDDDEYQWQDVLAPIAKEMYYKGKQYLLPSFCDGHMVLFQKEKVQIIENNPISVLDFQTYFNHLVSADFPVYTMKAHPSEIFLDFLPYLRSAGVEPFDEIGRPMFNCKKGIEALETYIKYIDYSGKKVINYGNEEVKYAIQKNQCQLAMTWSGQLGSVIGNDPQRQKTWDYAYPIKPWNVTWSFAISKKSNNQSMALRVVKALTNAEVDIEVGRICGNPTRYKSFESDTQYYPWYQTVKNMILSSHPLSSFPELPIAINMISEQLTDCVNGKITPKQALENAEKMVRSIKQQ